MSFINDMSYLRSSETKCNQLIGFNTLKKWFSVFDLYDFLCCGFLWNNFELTYLFYILLSYSVIILTAVSVAFAKKTYLNIYEKRRLDNVRLHIKLNLWLKCLPNEQQKPISVFPSNFQKQCMNKKIASKANDSMEKKKVPLDRWDQPLLGRQTTKSNKNKKQ